MALCLYAATTFMALSIRLSSVVALVASKKLGNANCPPLKGGGKKCGLRHFFLCYATTAPLWYPLSFFLLVSKRTDVLWTEIESTVGVCNGRGFLQ